MRIWLLGLTLGVSLGCASSEGREGEKVWCEHEHWWSAPHAVSVPEPDPLDLDLIGGYDPKETKLIEAYAAALEAGRERNEGLLEHVAVDLPACQAPYYMDRAWDAPQWDDQVWASRQAVIEKAYREVLECYEAPLLRDFSRDHPALWQRLSDLIRLAKRQAVEIAWRKLGDADREPLTSPFKQAERARDEFTELLYWFRSGSVSETGLKHFLEDGGFKELINATRRIWRLGGRNPRALTVALKSWRRRAQTRRAEPNESLEDLSLGAERYRDRALDAALDATLAAEGTRGD